MPSTAGEHVARMLTAQDEVSSSVQLRAKAPDDLRLEVEGIGLITFPVSSGQARQLCDLGGPARFGRGEQTLTDATVRDTWEIPKKLVGAEWAEGQGLGPELEDVREELGLPEHCQLTAELHSMLVYEEGQFFLPHQDSEKDDAMIATLVVTLPSAHSGGELVVHHLGEDITYRGSKTRLSLVAFYADCRHEIRPVTAGHRISLTYNLLLSGEPSGRVPDEATTGELARQLREHFSTRVRHPYRDATSEPPHRLVVLLDHEYTERGLSWQRLKGTDTNRALLLRAAVNAAGCEAVLALTEINETWDVNVPDDGYRRSGRGYRHWDDTDDDSAATAQGDDSRYELNDLPDSSIRLTRWTDPSGTSAEDISLAVADAEVCAATPTSDLRPYTSEYEGYMGNYGNTLDRWYRRAAVVVWPRDLSFSNRAEASPSWAMDDLLARARGGDPASARTAAATLAPFWDAAVVAQERPGQLLTKAQSAAAALDDAAAAVMLLRPFSVENLSRRQMSAFAELTGCYGEEWTDELLRAWSSKQPVYASVHGPSRLQWLTSLPALCEALLAQGNPGASTAHRLVELAWDSLTTLLSSCVVLQPATARRQQLASLGAPLAAVVTAAATTQAAELLDRIAGYCRQHADALTGCVVPALRAAAAATTNTRQNDTFRQLAASQTPLLRARLALPARATDDWSLELPAGCACELCATLRSFLRDPARRTLEWPLAQNSRSHVHSRIDQAELPITHQTRRQGRPYTLVLTKTAQLFDREALQRTRDQADLDWILEQWTSTADETPGSQSLPPTS